MALLFPRPLHHPSGGPPPPLSRGRKSDIIPAMPPHPSFAAPRHSFVPPHKRREAGRQKTRAPFQVRRAPWLRSRPLYRREPGPHRDPIERARSPFGAPPRPPRLRPLGSARASASWNHRMQTGGPSPAPVQRAPRRPALGRTGMMLKPPAGAVYGCTAREPPPLRIQEYPREGALRRAGWWLCNYYGDHCQDIVSLSETRHRGRQVHDPNGHTHSLVVCRHTR
jgi:hypothetical protein